MQTQDLTIDVDGSPMPSYLARPDGNEPKPAVIVLQEIFGVNAEVKRIADLFASAGYVALAINYYHRTHPKLNEPYTQEGLQVGFAAAGAVSRATASAGMYSSFPPKKRSSGMWMSPTSARPSGSPFGKPAAMLPP